MQRYASLIGPLRGIYYPLPEASRDQQRVMMNTSRLKNLWHSIYDEAEVDRQLKEYGGVKLPPDFAKKLDYDSFEVSKVE
jgi:anaerobic selenocysteine-containing dehydrogenase